MMPRVLHRRLVSLMAAAALIAFISGARLDMPSAILALGVVVLAAVRPPGAALAARLEPMWRVLAPLLAIRAAWALFVGEADAVLPMVDLLLLLMTAETLRQPNGTGDARIYSLSLALFVAGAAYRPGIFFLAGFVAYVVIGTVALVVGQVASQAEAHHVRRPIVRRALLTRSAALAIIPLLVATTVFATFPRVTRGWVSRGAPVEHSVVGFSDQVSLGTHGSRIHPNPAVALRVEFPESTAVAPGRMYWRGRSYDRFDGVSWSRGSAALLRPPPLPPPVGPVTEQVVYGVPLEQPVLFGLPTILEIGPESRMRVVRERGSDWSYLGAGAPVYRVMSQLALPEPDRLREPDYAVPAGLAAYLQMPAFSPRVHALADSIGDGAATAYDRARAIERWFHEGFAYTLELPRTPEEATLEHFLFQRRAGHCEYFSTAMVMLLRAQGIAARNVNGFLGGEWNDFGNFLTVTQNEAHSWVEAWFPAVGWVTFDPTPAALTQVAAARRSWLNPFRGLADGLEHRWSKWVLDYDLEKQVALFRRTSDALTNPNLVRDGDRAAGRVRPLAFLVLGILGAAAVLRLLGRLPGRPRTPVNEATRSYLALRRGYRKAGYDVPESVPPLAFAGALRAAGAPGADAAAAAVSAYAELRFSATEETGLAGRGGKLGPGGAGAPDQVRSRLDALHAHAAAARAALRAHRRVGARRRDSPT